MLTVVWSYSRACVTYPCADKVGEASPAGYPGEAARLTVVVVAGQAVLTAPHDVCRNEIAAEGPSVGEHAVLDL